MLSRLWRFGDMEQSPVVKPAETLGECRKRAGRRLLVIALRQFGHTIGFADHQPAQLHNGFLKHCAAVIRSEVDEAVVLVWAWLTAVSVKLYRGVETA